MNAIRSLKRFVCNTKKKHKQLQRYLAGHGLSPPVSECDFHSTASAYKDEDESKDAESEKDSKEVHS